MTNNDLIQLLQAGKVDEFNKFRKDNLRKDNPDFTINLSDAYLYGADLKGAYLNLADLKGASLRYADLSYASLRHADVRGADLTCAAAGGTNFTGAIFNKQQIAMLPELLGIKVIEDKQ